MESGPQRHRDAEKSHRGMVMRRRAPDYLCASVSLWFTSFRRSGRLSNPPVEFTTEAQRHREKSQRNGHAPPRPGLSLCLCVSVPLWFTSFRRSGRLSNPPVEFTTEAQRHREKSQRNGHAPPRPGLSLCLCVSVPLWFTSFRRSGRAQKIRGPPADGPLESRLQFRDEVPRWLSSRSCPGRAFDDPGPGLPLCCQPSLSLTQKTVLHGRFLIIVQRTAATSTILRAQRGSQRPLRRT